MAIDLITYPTNREDAAEDLYSLLMGSKIRNGVYKSWLNDFAVFADSTGMQVKVRSGQVIINGFDAHSLSTQTVTLDDADSVNPRIDRVILRLDRTDPSTISLDVLTGTPASSPVVAALTSTSTIIDLQLAQVRVDAGVSSIAPSKVTDERVYEALRGHGDGTPGTINSTSARAGSSPFTAPIDHSHPVDVAALRDLIIPVGSIWGMAAPLVPSRFLACNGQQVDRGTYPALAAYVTSLWGPSSSQFITLPNLQNFVLRGAGGNQGVGQERGQDTVTLTTSQLPLVLPSVDGDSGFRVVVTADNGAWGIPTWTGAGTRVSISDIDEFGGDQPHLNEQASKGVLWVIKAH